LGSQALGPIDYELGRNPLKVKERVRVSLGLPILTRHVISKSTITYGDIIQIMGSGIELADTYYGSGISDSVCYDRANGPDPRVYRD